MDPSPLRYLSDAEVQGLLPEPRTAVSLARRALVARAEGRAQVPPKPAVRLAGDGFANAMPAAVLDEDLLGCKWVTLVPDNPARGLPTAQGVMILSDARTGETRALMGAAALTAQRTAAVSGACLDALGDRSSPVAFLGAGVQARSHLLVLEALGYAETRVYARRPEAREDLSAWAAEAVPTLRLEVTDDPRAAVEGAGTVITRLSIGLRGQELDPGWVREDALLLPLDYSSSVGSRLAREATLVSDDVEQLAAVAPAKLAADYPPATGWTGDAIRQPRPAGRLVCQNLGIAATDVVFAAYVADRAADRGAGTVLAR
ncbi:ornithine cyclodeaminase family protein [Arsenicicoccus sp. UBA7492]|uniref:ornithine cyclodeaminase family protein n=1 Tax=Arsenicicoccus sp. UBA7492 TaxID=1946057 RepID=UPI0025797A71|nr:ornithine cyclodeaminase family protein [Arsenicicoccus sp. UBA7492]